MAFSSYRVMPTLSRRVGRRHGGLGRRQCQVVLRGRRRMRYVVLHRMPPLMGRCAKRPHYKRAGVPPGACPGARAGPGARRALLLCRLGRGL